MLSRMTSGYSIIFQPIIDIFKFTLSVKICFSLTNLLIVILGLSVHKRILFFLKHTVDRNVDPIIAFQAKVNCILLPVTLSFNLGMQCLNQLCRYITSYGCYIGSFLGKKHISEVKSASI